MPAKRDSTGSSISKLTVKELKERLLKRGLSTSGLKAELVSRLEETTKKDPEQVCWITILDIPCLLI